MLRGIRWGNAKGRARRFASCVGVVGLLATLLGCASRAEDPISRTVRGLTTHSSFVALLPDSSLYMIVNPAQCTICNSEIGQAERWAHGFTTRHYRLVLSRAATVPERVVLIRYRLAPDTVLNEPGLTGDGPVAVLVVGNHEVARAIGQREIRALIDRIALPGAGSESQDTRR